MDANATLSSPCNGFAARLCNDERGVTAIEYGLLAALIVVACVGAVSATGVSLNDMYEAWSAAVAAALGGAL